MSITEVGDAAPSIIEGPTGITPFVKAGKLRPIGVVSVERIPEFSDVPTMEEQGIKGMPPDAWQGIVAPSGTPVDIVAKLNRVINAGLSSPGADVWHHKAGRQSETHHSGRIRLVHCEDEAGMGEGHQGNRCEGRQLSSHPCRRLQPNQSPSLVMPAAYLREGLSRCDEPQLTGRQLRPVTSSRMVVEFRRGYYGNDDADV